MRLLDDHYELPLQRIGKDEVLFVPTLSVDWEYGKLHRVYGCTDNTKVFGRYNRVYAVPVAMKPSKFMPYFTIKYYLDKFFFHVRKHPHLNFLVPYFKAVAYNDEVLGRLFRPAKDFDNIYICKEFYPFATTDEELILLTDCGYEFSI
jgi:hypothetical protein